MSLDIDDLFDSEETTPKQEKVSIKSIEIPVSFQVRKVSNGKDELIETFMVDKVRGIIPIEKAKRKAQLMKSAFPKDSIYVVEVLHRVVKTF